jgi:hypothetical protein
MTQIGSQPKVISKDIIKGPGLSQTMLDLENALKLLKTSSTSRLEDQMGQELQFMRDRTRRLQFMHNAIKIINAAADKDGKIDFGKNPELIKLREQGKEMQKLADQSAEESKNLNNEATKLEMEAEEAEKNGDHATALAKRKEADGKKFKARLKAEESRELTDVVNALQANSSKLVYDKNEKNQLVEGLRMTCDDFNTLHQMSTTQSNKLYAERNEMIAFIKDFFTKLHNIGMSWLKAK